MVLVVLYEIVYLFLAAAILICLWQAKSLKEKATYAMVALPLLLRLFWIK